MHWLSHLGGTLRNTRNFSFCLFQAFIRYHSEAGHSNKKWWDCLFKFGKQIHLCGRPIHLLLPKWLGIDCEVFCICRAYHVIEQHQRTISCIMRGGQVLQKAFKKVIKKKSTPVLEGKALLWTCRRAYYKKWNRELSKKMKPPDKVFCFLMSQLLWMYVFFVGIDAIFYNFSRQHPEHDIFFH